MATAEPWVGFLRVDAPGHPGLSGDAQLVAPAASVGQQKARSFWKQLDLGAYRKPLPRKAHRSREQCSLDPVASTVPCLGDR